MILIYFEGLFFVTVTVMSRRKSVQNLYIITFNFKGFEKCIYCILKLSKSVVCRSAVFNASKKLGCSFKAFL